MRYNIKSFSESTSVYDLVEAQAAATRDDYEVLASAAQQPSSTSVSTTGQTAASSHVLVQDQSPSPTPDILHELSPRPTLNTTPDLTLHPTSTLHPSPILHPTRGSSPAPLLAPHLAPPLAPPLAPLLALPRPYHWPFLWPHYRPFFWPHHWFFARPHPRPHQWSFAHYCKEETTSATSWSTFNASCSRLKRRLTINVDVCSPMPPPGFAPSSYGSELDPEVQPLLRLPLRDLDREDESCFLHSVCFDKCEYQLRVISKFGDHDKRQGITTEEGQGSTLLPYGKLEHDQDNFVH
ncbi:hypothetical protein MRX96_025036 [Rhipicephalus microplus]